MAKTHTAEMVKETPAAAGLQAQAAQTAALTQSQKLERLARLMGVEPDQTEIISAGKIPFWPALEGAMCSGTVQNYRTVPTKFGDVGLYTVRVDQPCLGGTADGEILELQKGDLVTVIERTVIKSLGQDGAQGRKVGFLCLGQVQGKEFPYWDFAIMAKREQNNGAQLPANASPNS